jgi:hypothetical protein
VTDQRGALYSSLFFSLPKRFFIAREGFRGLPGFPVVNSFATGVHGLGL